MLRSFTYTLDNTGRRTAIIEDSGRTTHYNYDDLYRLTSEIITDTTNGNYNATYEYDKVGNRTYETKNGVQTQYTYDDNDRLTQQGGTTYAYDDNGNTLTETIDADSTSYSWDSQNRLIGSEVTESGLTTNSTYSYDVDNNRVAKTTDNGTDQISTSFIVDNNQDYAQVLHEVDNATLSTEVTYTFGDDLLAQNRSGQTQIYHSDGLGSTRLLTDDTGVQTDSYDYEAFGQTLNQVGFTENSYLFTGEQFDSELDQYYLRARFYNQAIGRFWSMDSWKGSVSRPITLNKYLYANSEPVGNIDPSGYFSLGSVMSTLSIAESLYSTSTVLYDLFSSAESGGELSARDIGIAVVLSKSSGGARMLKSLSKKVCTKIKCNVPILDVVHIFKGEFRKRTPQGFHSLAMPEFTTGKFGSRIERIDWKNLNGVYSAKVSLVNRNGVRKMKKRNSTFFPNYWSKSMVTASLYASWIRHRGKNKGATNFGVTKIQHYVFNGFLRGHPVR